MAKYGLDLQRKKSNKKPVLFACLFICLVLLIGTFSVVVFLKHYNYDLDNIFVKGEESTTQVTTTEAPDKVTYEGGAVFLVAVTSDNKAETRFINLISTDLGEKTIKVIPVDDTVKSKSENQSYSDILYSKGVKELVLSLESDYGVRIDKYAVFTDTGYKTAFRNMGKSITVTVSDDVEYDTADMFLELKRGENTLAPEKVYKYMKYICETSKGIQKSKLNAEIIVSAFNTYFNNETFLSGDSYFSTLVNCCSTDISIVDYTDSKDKIQYLMPKSSKEKLKVYVSKELTYEEKF